MTNWLEKWVQFRTTDWMTELEYPEYTAKEVAGFLAFQDRIGKGNSSNNSLLSI